MKNRRIDYRQQPPRRVYGRLQIVGWLLALLVATTVSAGVYRYSRPIDEPTVQTSIHITSEDSAPDIAWPQAQAALGTVSDGVLVSKPDQTPRPTASTAKLITVLTVLQEKPLKTGESGPILTLDQSDVDLYNSYYAAGGSLVAVELGEKLSQYQMMQGILIRSGNNLADSLAIWAFGSLSNYQVAAQKYVDSLGMANTTVGTDASGLSSTTTSTAEDLVRLGIAAMKHEVVREIVRQPSSNLPVDGNKPSTNWMLGQNGVVGIKTGNIPAVGGVFVIASEYTTEGQEPITIVGAVQGATTTYSAIAESGRLAEAIKPLFVSKLLVKKGDVVATITTPWGDTTDVIAAEDITTFGWKYTPVESPKLVVNGSAPIEKGATVGSLSIGDKKVDMVAKNGIQEPSWQWRLATSR